MDKKLKRLLDKYAKKHIGKGHNLIYGNNFIECVNCKFHIHVIGDTVWKHWKTHESWVKLETINE